jgi:hypothetical protein
MDSKNIIVIVLILAFIALRLYQRFGKKGQKEGGKGKTSGPSMQSSAGDDDYEPYAKK